MSSLADWLDNNQADYVMTFSGIGTNALTYKGTQQLPSSLNEPFQPLIYTATLEFGVFPDVEKVELSAADGSPLAPIHIYAAVQNYYSNVPLSGYGLLSNMFVNRRTGDVIVVLGLTPDATQFDRDLENVMHYRAMMNPVKKMYPSIDYSVIGAGNDDYQQFINKWDSADIPWLYRQRAQQVINYITDFIQINGYLLMQVNGKTDYDEARDAFSEPFDYNPDFDLKQFQFATELKKLNK